MRSISTDRRKARTVDTCMTILQFRPGALYCRIEKPTKFERWMRGLFGKFGNDCWIRVRNAGPTFWKNECSCVMLQGSESQIMSKPHVAIYFIHLRFTYVTENLFSSIPSNTSRWVSNRTSQLTSDDLLPGTGLAK